MSFKQMKNTLLKLGKCGMAFLMACTLVSGSGLNNSADVVTEVEAKEYTTMNISPEQIWEASQENMAALCKNGFSYWTAGSCTGTFSRNMAFAYLSSKYANSKGADPRNFVGNYKIESVSDAQNKEYTENRPWVNAWQLTSTLRHKVMNSL